MAEIKLRAERRAGELLQDMEKNEGGRPAETSNIVLPVSPTLAEIGITKIQSSRWQTIAKIPEEVFEQHLAETDRSQNARHRRVKQSWAGVINNQ